MNIVDFADKLFYLYFVLIILYCFMSFFPNIDRNSGFAGGLTAIVEPYLAIFRKFIPPVGGLDFSPIIAILALQLIQWLVCSLLDIIF